MNILLIGQGRMGQAIQELFLSSPYTIVDVLSLEHQRTEKSYDVVIDFSSKDALPLTFSYALKSKVPLIIGTTGYSEEQLEAITQASQHIPILFEANFSLGVHLLQKIAALLHDFDRFYTPYLIETHHKQKKDQPSGTAKQFVSCIEPSHIFSLRGGNIPGEHCLTYLGEDESLHFIHRAYHPRLFARGVLFCLPHFLEKKAGLYHFDSLL